MGIMARYVELHARAAFSFLQGASTPEELIATCSKLKMPSMALLDQDGLYGAARFHLAGKKLGIKAHIGAEITVRLGSRANARGYYLPPANAGSLSQIFAVPLLVQNRTGYQNLCRLITLMKLRVPKHSKPGECAVTPDELAEHAEGLICLTGGTDGPLWEALSLTNIVNRLDAGVGRRRGRGRAPLNKIAAFLKTVGKTEMGSEGVAAAKLLA